MYGELAVVLLVVCNVHWSSAVIYACNQSAACGCSTNHANVFKIVGGEDAFPSSWGWAVSLQTPTVGHFCTGSIVSPLHIITAAHCVTDAEFTNVTTVVVGINRLSDSLSSGAQVRLVSQVVAHPAYDASTQMHDIAVLRLAEPLAVSAALSTARLCFPRVEPASETSRYPGDLASLVAVGWGNLHYDDASIPNNLYLQQVTVEAVPIADARCGMFITNSSTQFCAGVTGGGKDTCQGDSGGPLMRFEPKQARWLLAGVTSFGLGCADPRYAGVYTRASVYRDWLRSVVSDGLTEALGEPYSSAVANRLNVCLALFSIMQLLFHFT